MSMESSRKTNFKYDQEGGRHKKMPDEGNGATFNKEAFSNKKNFEPLPAEKGIF